MHHSATMDNHWGLFRRLLLTVSTYFIDSKKYDELELNLKLEIVLELAH